MRADLRASGPVPALVWLWFAAMAAMLGSLWIAHVDWGLGLPQTIKSTIGWAKGWALLALFIFAGAVLPVRRGVVVRAQSILSLWTLVLLPLMFVAPFVGLPEKIFVSPLKAAGGPGPEYFSVYLYTLDPSNWTPRWQFFAPWSPFAGLIGVMTVAFAEEEKDRRWMMVGIAAGVAMILLSKSRMSLVALVVCTVGPRMVPLLARGIAWQFAAGVAASMAVLGTAVLQFVLDGVSTFKSARADSTRVREALQRIAYERWQSEAVWFGHGTVQPGPHIVEFMPIGSHHTWFGLLFVKGLTGLIALAIPMVTHFFVAFVDAIKHRRGRLPLSVLLVLIILTFGENLEIEAYLLWPGLLAQGIHLREMSGNATPEATG